MKIYISRLIKSEELNHHGTLFAGRMAEWFVEACFIVGAKVTEMPENIVCVNIHGLSFKKPAKKGDIINLESRIAKVGNSSFTVYGKITKNNETDPLSDGFITFVCLDENNNKIPHNIVLGEAEDEEEILIRKRAEELQR